MLDKIVCYISGWFGRQHYLHIPKSFVQRCSDQSHASDWHSYAITQRPWRPHVCVPCIWITKYLPRTAHVFEAGCGSGANLLWLHQQGFSRLSGNDISPSAVHMSQLLAQYVSADMNIVVDDAMQPAIPPQAVDALLSVNWLYHIPGASLDGFLSLYKKYLAPKGFIAFDSISTAYNVMKDNQYHTKDVHLPVAERRASEYTFRMSLEEVEKCLQKQGFVMLEHKVLHSWPPRMAFLAQSME